jgi:hypothetical protein
MANKKAETTTAREIHEEHRLEDRHGDRDEKMRDEELTLL